MNISHKQKEIRKNIIKAIDTKLFPGAVVGFIEKKTHTIIAVGHKPNTIFDIASITKSIPTSCLALQFLEQGKINLTGPIKKFIPEIRNNYCDEITSFHLLTHTLNFGKTFRLSHCKNLKPKQLWNTVFTAPLAERPGKHRCSSNVTSLLLTLLIERIGKSELEKLSMEQFFRPLQMKRTTFHPLTFSKQNIAPTENDPWRGKLIHGEIHDESAWILGKEKVVGSAGLFSTVPDLLKFTEMLLDKGKIKKHVFFQPETIERMQKNQLKDINEWGSFGWELHEDYMSRDHADHTFGKTGFTGCSVMVDVPCQKSLVILTNCVYPHRPKNRAPQRAFYRSVADSIFSNFE